MKITFDADSLIIAAFDRFAKDQGTSRSALMRDAMYEYVRAAVREARFAPAAPTFGPAIESSRMRVADRSLVPVDEFGLRIET
jgi:hypothetical protein